MDERRMDLRDARVAWRRDNVIGVAFADHSPERAAPSDLDERLRRSEQKKRELQIEIQRLLEK